MHTNANEIVAFVDHIFSFRPTALEERERKEEKKLFGKHHRTWILRISSTPLR
jgi:hypothetical protein